jgi:hypothetical protein
MNGLFNLLTPKERRTASTVGAALGAAACLFLIFALRERGAAGRAAAALAGAESEYLTLVREQADAHREWQVWADARKDIAAIKADRLYAGRTVIQDLRRDLQRIFDEAGIAAEDITYGYADLVKGILQEVTVEFRFSGNYPTLIRLLGTVERLPRFVHVEKIDFLNIGNPFGAIDVRVGLAGYYERP